MTNIIMLVMAMLVQVESAGKPGARGDGGRAVGLYQMWPVAVAEANRIEAIYARREGRQARQWTLADRLSRTASGEMAWITLRWHYDRGATDPVTLAGRWRNPYSECPKWYRRRLLHALAGRKANR